MHNTQENIKWRTTGSFVEDGYVFGGFSFGVKPGEDVAAEDGLALRNSTEERMVVHGSLIHDGSIECALGTEGGSVEEKDVRDSF